MNIALWLTLSRLCLLPLAVLPVLANWHDPWLVAAAVTAFAGLTDVFDGYLARLTGQVSVLGANLDLICDKVFVGVMLVLLAWSRLIPAWAPIIVILREVVISLVRLVRFGSRSPSPDVWGKAKTAVSFIAILLALVQQSMRTGGMPVNLQWFLSPLSSLTPWVVFAAVMLTVLSGLNYLAAYSRFKKTDAPSVVRETLLR